MRIGKYFTLKDVSKSTTALRMGIDNTPHESAIMVAIEYVMTVVDQIKDRFPSVRINSFYRSHELNKAIGGAVNSKGESVSQHCRGEAVDLDSDGDKYNLEVFNLIKDDMVFDQLILEYPSWVEDENGELKCVPSWVHVSLIDISKDKTRRNRQQVLVKLKKGYIPFGQFQKGMI